MRSWGALPILPIPNGIIMESKLWMKDKMEFLVAIVRFFFCGLNMVSPRFQIYLQNISFLPIVGHYHQREDDQHDHLDVAGAVRLLHQPPHLPAHVSPGEKQSKQFWQTFHTHSCAAAGQPGVRQVVVPSEQNPQQDQILLHLLLHSLINIALCEHFGHKLFVSLICWQFPMSKIPRRLKSFSTTPPWQSD